MEKTAMAAALGICVGTFHFGAVLAPADGDQHVEQGGFEGREVIHGKVAVRIMEDAIRRAQPA